MIHPVWSVRHCALLFLSKIRVIEEMSLLIILSVVWVKGL